MGYGCASLHVRHSNPALINIYMYVCIYCMTKVISVSDEAYERLSRIKGRDSFTGTILRLTNPKKKKTLLDVVREMKPNEELARNTDEAIKTLRKMKFRRFDL